MTKQDLIAELEIRLKLAQAGGADVIKFSPEDVRDIVAHLRNTRRIPTLHSPVHSLIGGYIEAMLADIEETMNDLSYEAMNRIRADCEPFIQMLQADYSRDQMVRMGRDFWIARQGLREPIETFAEFGGWKQLNIRARAFPRLVVRLDPTGQIQLDDAP